MKIKALLSVLLSFMLAANVCFAQEGTDNTAPGNEIPLETINENDTYQAQTYVEESEKTGKTKSEVLKKVEGKKTMAGKPVTADKVQSTYKKASKSSVITKIFDTLGTWWKKFKKWFLNLPGIRHYRKSKYSGDNYKKEMDSMGGEYGKHLGKKSQGVKMVKKGSKEFFK